jgi:hypothetical protein
MTVTLDLEIKIPTYRIEDWYSPFADTGFLNIARK